MTVGVPQPRRVRFPDRRESETIRVRSVRLNKTLHVTVSFLTSGRIGEVFVSGAKVGSDAEAMIAEWATLLSISLQMGMALSDYALNVQRFKDGTPLSVLGEIVDEILKLEPT